MRDNSGMPDQKHPMAILTEERCWDLLAGQSLGRLVTAIGNVPEVFPVNFVVDGPSVVFRTAEGTKLFQLTVNERVAFEVDFWNEERGWSVVVHGTARVIDTDDERARADKMPLMPWVPTVKTNYVRLTADEITGREFVFGPDPVHTYI